MSNESYLGDGVYIETKEGMLELKAHSGGQDNVIFLEPEVMNKLISYYKDLLGVQVL